MPCRRLSRPGLMSQRKTTCSPMRIPSPTLALCTGSTPNPTCSLHYLGNTHQNDWYVVFCVLLQLLYPLGKAIVGGSPCNVENDQSSRRPLVVGLCDGSKPLLSSGVPYLGLDLLVAELKGFGGELDSDGGLRLLWEFIVGEAREEVGFADARILIRKVRYLQWRLAWTESRIGRWLWFYSLYEEI